MLRYTEHKLVAGTAPRVRYEYVVTGRGEFPLDMLRYDMCWPCSSSDVAKMDSNLIHSSREPRSIAIRAYTAPTVARWSSFGWSCGTERLDKDAATVTPICRSCGEEGHTWQRCPHNM